MVPSSTAITGVPRGAMMSTALCTRVRAARREEGVHQRRRVDAAHGEDEVPGQQVGRRRGGGTPSSSSAGPGVEGSAGPTQQVDRGQGDEQRGAGQEARERGAAQAARASRRAAPRVPGRARRAGGGRADHGATRR